MKKGQPFLPSGALILLRAADGGDEPEHTLEICEDCKARLLKAFPALAKIVEAR